MNDAVERLRLMASAQPWFGMRKEEWQPYADARSILSHIDTLTAKLAEALRVIREEVGDEVADAIEAGQHRGNG